MFPVEVAYLKEPCVDYTQKAVQTVFDIHLRVSCLEPRFCGQADVQEPAGDVLVFLTGREEIDQALQQVADRSQT